MYKWNLFTNTYIQIHQRIKGCDTKPPEQLLTGKSGAPFINQGFSTWGPFPLSISDQLDDAVDTQCMFS